jgi:hypothetical protein
LNGGEYKQKQSAAEQDGGLRRAATKGARRAVSEGDAATVRKTFPETENYTMLGSDYAVIRGVSIGQARKTASNRG